MPAELTLKLRLALHKTPLSAEDSVTPSDLRTAFTGIVKQVAVDVASIEPPESELHVEPIQTECTSTYLMVGLQTYFRIETDRPEQIRQAVQRVALETEARLRAAYDRSVRIEVAEVWRRRDREASA